jgi:TRAP-type C4-dicarboxylate transport system substrate-binding protein
VQDAANESVVKEKQYWKETIEDNMKVLKEANVQFIYPDKTLFSNQADALTKILMQDPKKKIMIERIRAVGVNEQ